MDFISRAKSLFDRPDTIDEVKLVAWHHMINDPFLSTYVMDGDREVRVYVNKKLAIQRAAIGLADWTEKFHEMLVQRIAPGIGSAAEAMKDFGLKIEQAYLGTILSEPEDV